jgi:ABC-2 type transport system ATP-binding protein
VTVFLTTQYLEEADLLADRLAIIHRGHIVAEGTPEDLKATIGRPTVEVVPADPEQRDAVARVLELFGTPTTGAPGALAVRVESEGDLGEIVRALDAEELHVANAQLHAPSLDDVFLAKTGRSLEGAEEEAEAVTA